MSGNTLGTLFTVTTFGESHGPAIGCVIDGCPPGMELSEADIQPDLDRRTPGTSIALLIKNVDQRSKDYDKIAKSFRPGHADYTYLKKYGIRDPRGGGRASARLTAPAVAAGAVAKKWLREKYGVEVRGYLSQLGPNRVEFKSWDDVGAEGNPFFVADASRVAELETYMDKLRKSGESVGARLNVVASGVPAGWGEPLYGRLDADIAQVMMGINAVKGVEIGAGFRSVEQLGTEHSDEMTPEGFLSNNAGGILGGISTGQDVLVSIAIKPTSSIRLPRRTIDVDGNPTTIETHGRHDPCVGIRATPIAEAFLALVLADHALRHRAQNADVKEGAIAKGSKSAQKLEDPDPLEA